MTLFCFIELLFISEMRHFPKLTYNVASCAVCICSVLLLFTDGETSFQKIVVLA
jgi:hypothetical protein